MAEGHTKAQEELSNVDRGGKESWQDCSHCPCTSPQPLAHEAEENTIVMIQENGWHWTEGPHYKLGGTSKTSPFAQSLFVISVGTIVAANKSNISFSFGATTCFKEESMRRIPAARLTSNWLQPNCTQPFNLPA